MTRSVTVTPSVSKTLKHLTITSTFTSEIQTEVATSTVSSQDTTKATKTTIRTKIVAPTTTHVQATTTAASGSGTAKKSEASLQDAIRAGLAAVGAFVWLALHLG